MLKSMTGFGTATLETSEGRVTVEIKTLNSKFLDVYCRIPKAFTNYELEVRNYLTQQLERGKVECTVTVQEGGVGQGASSLNRAQAKAYFEDLKQAAKELGVASDDTQLFQLVLQLPNVFQTEAVDETQQTQTMTVVREALRQAAERCDLFRQQEGAATAGKLRSYTETIGALLVQVEEQDLQRLPMIRARLQKSVKELISDEGFDRNRFEQELIYYAEKLDISEEKMRLQHHLTFFLDSLISPDSNGKKLNFIAQEIGREINTIGSKANDAVMQRLVVQMKDELEKIKEQTLNIL
jgi:uncharacterized protein (TIGR00255 family)